MKKVVLFLLGIFLITGCSSSTGNTINDFKNKYDNKSYYLNAKMKLYADEEVFNYNVDVYYLKNDYYKVEMNNEANNNKQVIIKNDDGLYVITPALNKSFKFESTWPNNSSQGYILSSLINDLNDDSTVEDKEDYKVINTKVNYPNNPEITYEKIYIKDGNLEKVEVYTKDDNLKIEVTFNNIELNKSLSKDDFKISDYVKDDCTDDTCKEETTSSIDNAIYPLYIPSSTYLKNSEVVESDSDKRVILTFAGEKNFVIVEEASKVNTELEVIPVYGDPLMLNDTIGATSNNSIYWTSNNIDYYLVSSDLTTAEMYSIASSLGNYAQVSVTK